MDETGVIYPVRSAVARHYIIKGAISAKDVLSGKKIIPAGSLVIWQRGTSWQGHIGLTTKEWRGAKGQTVEGNTSSLSDRSGGNVEMKIRTIQPHNYFRITHFVPTTTFTPDVSAGYPALYKAKL